MIIAKIYNLIVRLVFSVGLFYFITENCIVLSGILLLCVLKNNWVIWNKNTKEIQINLF